jgi:hypothetical protein
MMMFSKRKALLLTLFVIFFLAGVVVFLRTWYMPHRNVQSEKGIAVTADAIFTAYSTDEAKANATYLNKAVEVSGTVASVTKNQDGKTVVMLKTADPMFGVQCTLAGEATAQPGEQVTVKGVCTGFLADVVVTDASITGQ